MSSPSRYVRLSQPSTSTGWIARSRHCGNCAAISRRTSAASIPARPSPATPAVCPVHGHRAAKQFLRGATTGDRDNCDRNEGSREREEDRRLRRLYPPEMRGRLVADRLVQAHTVEALLAGGQRGCGNPAPAGQVRAVVLLQNGEVGGVAGNGVPERVGDDGAFHQVATAERSDDVFGRCAERVSQQVADRSGEGTRTQWC